ncbi:unnamed protein product [Rhizoctonia solani]|uniref:Uncharacterized protein n=1 Tax=Rhizoctonia solani TaxID=456999 RepID=A0A8H3HXF8_9AGAM|nr:unnamed protein product [Rhizoctonia solani]
MASLSHEDHADLDSLFGDVEYQDELENEPQIVRKRSMIQFPRAAVLSQNVGTIAPSSVPSSTEHHSSGHLSSPSILPTMSTVSEATLSCGKRNASPGPSPQTKRRRIDTESSASTNNPKNILANLGLPVGASNTLTQAKLKSVAGLLAPSTNTSRSTSRALKGKKSSAVATVNSSAPPATSGTGTATDPVIISDEPANQSPPLVLSAGAKRTTRSQEAHILLDTLPDDPSDVLTQTLRTILKTPTAVPRGRSTVSRDTAVYLANGRFTGTPFLRLLRHLAGPTRRTNPALGLALLKKLVEAMRATENAVSKPAPAGPSSAASTPMPVTPETPSATSFAPPGGSTLHYAEKTFEPSLFSDIDFSAIGLDALSLPTIPEASPIAPTDIAIDPELLALSDHPGYYQNLTTPQNFDNFDLGLAELFNALPPAPDGQTLASASLTISEPLAVDPSMDWNALADIPFEELLSTWAPEEQPLPATNLPQTNVHAFPLPLLTPQPLAVPTTPISAQPIKPQASSSSGTMRIPARAEALTLLERARAHKKGLEEKLLLAKRQLWGCKIEAGVGRNLLEALKKA